MGLPVLHIAVPTPDGRVIDELFEWMMSALKTRGWQINMEIVKGQPSMSARNRLCRRFLESKADYLFTIDSDQIPYIDSDKRESGLEFLLEDITTDHVDTVSILTVRRTVNGPIPVIQKLTGPASSELYAEILQRPYGLHELVGGAMGGAGIIIKRRVIQKFWDTDTLWFEDVYQTKKGVVFDAETGEDLYGTRVVGHDIRFYQRCHEFGFRSFVDTRVLWGHLKELDLRDEFLRDMNQAKRIEALEKADRILHSKLRAATNELALLKNGKVPA